MIGARHFPEPIMKRKVGVVLSGCGFLDGSEIHEAVFTLLHLDELGVDAVCMAPRGAQRHVVDHATQQPVPGEARDVLRESARIARGRITDLAEVSARDVDALVLPGGFGAAKNLCDFAVAGAKAAAHPEVARLLREVHAAKKPIGAICIAPAVVAAVLGPTVHPLLTIGDDRGTADALAAMGARHQDCDVRECVVDADARIVTCPAYMFDARPGEVSAGIRRLCEAVVGMLATAPAGGAR
jgi:enhancing lycopene biosynthesis protein 2